MGIRGQTVVEYIVLIGIITVALIYMGPLFKRGVQTLVKVSADQIGNQQNSDQEIAPRDYGNPVKEGVSYLVNSATNTRATVNKSVTTPGWGGVADISLNESTNTNSESVTDLGYTAR